MGYPTKVQRIKREKSEQWYINFPSAIALAIGLERGEVVEWSIDDHNRLVLQRKGKSLDGLKKKLLNKK
jgi:bifunctional DNA-binding transcriptional regulator/antitoxin component of YhaV-PrlF toxin-antitoxin module